ncbi:MULTISPECIES: hybrid sensor histidine kinase/response regulator [Nostoc]|uniref:histidine kinase n=2 Tax=Nostoc TaxID=1177 RepID=A0ABR8IIS2_9NOSO|nr:MULTISPECIES: response regulator [Nostoc]MBD2564959.1 response regulator [Nostoc linckia FACHB-391]MBD2651088.1 response regulator [Nostoc foliaceum FACHB-393]
MNRLLKPASQTNILLIDDTPDNLRLLAKMLELQGYTVRKSLNGRMALQAAGREPPDLILLDINMPEMNGYEVCQQLKILDTTRNIPIIFISALDQVRDKIRAFEMGGQDYITKPFQELEVLARIRNQLLIQQQHHQLELEIEERQRAEAQVKLLNVDLEQRVQLRTQQLQQSLNFEATLKRISDKVRDSLDQHQILQSAIEELARALEVKCCDAVLYKSDRQSSVIRYQYIASGQPSSQGQMLYMSDAPEIYNQLQQQKSYLAFCQIQPIPIRNHSAILACSIFDERVEETGILGDLWLFKNTHSPFSDMEIHLVQQVANQCAIALRQVSLYEAAQAQVKELQRLNQLKDDFLNTISHELRSPVANMIQLLKSLNEQGEGLIPEISSCQDCQMIQYLTMLQEECDRELKLIEDILSLQHLEAGTYPQQLTRSNLQDLIGHIIEKFQIQIQNQQQTFEIDLASDLPTIDIDSFSLSHIVTELLNNANKYTPPGEMISLAVSVSQDQTAGQACILNSLHDKLSFLQLIVANTGVEIPPEELPRIFDKFYRIPSHNPWNHSGTGLGLALVKKLVEKMNGDISAESMNNQTKFIIKFPFTTIFSVNKGWEL